MNFLDNPTLSFWSVEDVNLFFILFYISFSIFLLMYIFIFELGKY